jgi:hypothetical protein
MEIQKPQDTAMVEPAGLDERLAQGIPQAPGPGLPRMAKAQEYRLVERRVPPDPELSGFI